MLFRSVWHIYSQAEAAHEVKLRAFLDVFGEVLPADSARVVRNLWLAWNGVAAAPPLASAWPEFLACRQAQRQGLRLWREKLLELGDLAGNLQHFCSGLVAKK